MKKLPFVLFALAFALRLLHIAQIRHAPFYPLLMGDSRAYDEWALRIAGGDWMGREVFYQAPLYPYFLGLLYSIAGRHLTVVRIVQAAIGSSSCVFLFLACRRFLSERAGLAAGLILALWAPAIFFDGLIQKSVLDLFFICVLLWLVSLTVNAEGAGPAERKLSSRVSKSSPQDPRSLRSTSPFLWFSMGLTLGALALTRENALVFVIVIGIWAMTARDRWRRLALAAAGVILVLGPVALRNYAVGGGLYVTTAQFGPNFYIGNNPKADGTYASLRFGRGAPEYERQDATEIAERAIGHRLSPGEVSSYWTDRAMTFITSRPADWLRLTGRKVLLLWNATEMVDTESQETYAEWSWPLRLLGPITHFGLLVPLALIGLVVTRRDRARYWVPLALVVTYAASVVPFYILARYRYPLVPLLIVFASVGAVRLPALLRTPGTLRLQLAAAVVATLVFTNWPVIPKTWLRAVSENNVGAALLEAKRFDEAEPALRKATELRPGFAPALNNLGVALAGLGRTDDAVVAYRAAAAQTTDPDPDYNAGNALFRANRFDEAIQSFERALDRDQTVADVHNNLAMALAATQQSDRALREYRLAVQLDPKAPQPRRNLADLLADTGKMSEAIDEMRRALALAPEDGSLHYDLGTLLLDAERFDEATNAFRDAIRLAPRSFPAHNNLGISLASQQKFDEAIEIFRQALTLATSDREKADAQRNLDTASAAKRRP